MCVWVKLKVVETLFINDELLSATYKCIVVPVLRKVSICPRNLHAFFWGQPVNKLLAITEDWILTYSKKFINMLTLYPHVNIYPKFVQSSPGF